MVLVFREHFYPIVATTIVGSSTDTPKWRLFRRRVYVYMPVEQVLPVVRCLCRFVCVVPYCVVFFYIVALNNDAIATGDLTGRVRAETGGYARTGGQVREVHPGKRRQTDTSRSQSKAGGWGDAGHPFGVPIFCCAGGAVTQKIHSFSTRATTIDSSRKTWTRQFSSALAE